MDILDNENIIVTVPDYLLEESNDNVDEVPFDDIELESSSDNINQVDYSEILESIDSRLETLESIESPDYTEQIQNISDNCFRLYYFIGGLYIAFAIFIGIKFWKIFF